MSPVVSRTALSTPDAVDASAAPDAPLDSPRASSLRRPDAPRFQPDRRFDTPRGSAFRHELPSWR